MNKVKTQHFVPRFYLKRFASSDNKVFVYDKSNNKVFKTAVENIACENYFYDSEIINKEHPEEQYLEKFYSKIESEFSRFYIDFIAKIESKEKDFISQEDKKVFANYFVLQIDRTKEHREMSKQSYDVSREQFIEHGVTKKQLIEFGMELENLDPKELHIESILAGKMMRESFSKILEHHIWVLIENNTVLPFFTSDNPIAKKENKKGEHIFYDGYASEGIEIIFPLNPKYLLVLLEREHFKNCEKLENNKLVITDIKNVNYYNSLEIFESYRQVFSCENCFEIFEEIKRESPESLELNRARIK